MPGVTEPETGLVFYELSHEWGHGVPTLPGYEEVKLYRSSTHAKNGVMATRIRMVMHSGTHVNAPLHLIQRAPGIGDIALERFFGSGVVLSIPKKQWEFVTVADLESATPTVEADDIVVIVTGWHRRYSDSIEYFGHSPGLAREAAEWLAAKGVKLVAVDTPQVDHPLATSLGLQRNGPQMKRLPKAYQTCDRARSKDRFSRMESGAPRAAERRHSDHRECRRRSRRAHRQTLHLPCLSVELAGRRRLRRALCRAA